MEEINNYKEARKLFPKMPEEIFKLWLDEMIKTNGLPSNESKWEGLLRGRSLLYWSQLNWEKRIIHLNQDMLSQETMKILINIGESNREILISKKCKSLNKENYHSRQMGDVSKEKLENIMKFIKKNSKLPNPLILIQEKTIYEIADGCHRLTAFLFSKESSNLNSLEAWVGKINKI